MKEKRKGLALLLIDFINDFAFDDGDELLKTAVPAARRVGALKKAARRSGIPVIYVNDNFQNWRDDFKATVAHVFKSEKGGPIARKLLPAQDDYFVLKPKHSAFYSTSLDLLLRDLGAKTLILTGITTDICVLITANDAYMRDYKIIVPTDCVAAVKEKQNEEALDYIERVLKADLRTSSELISKNFRT